MLQSEDENKVSERASSLKKDEEGNKSKKHSTGRAGQIGPWEELRKWQKQQCCWVRGQGKNFKPCCSLKGHICKHYGPTGQWAQTPNMPRYRRLRKLDHKIEAGTTPNNNKLPLVLELISTQKPNQPNKKPSLPIQKPRNVAQCGSRWEPNTACRGVLSLHSCPTLQAYPTRLLCPWDSPGNNTGVAAVPSCKGIFPTQAWNPRLLYLLHWQAASLSPGKTLAQYNAEQSFLQRENSSFLPTLCSFIATTRTLSLPLSTKVSVSISFTVSPPPASLPLLFSPSQPPSPT